MLVDVLRIGSLMNVRRVRRLPMPGQVLVNEGAQVHPEDVIAEASLPGELMMLDIARSLGVGITEAQGCLVRQPGEVLHIDDIVAQIEGPFPRLVRSPIEAKFAAFHRGCAVLEVGKDTIQVVAGIIGVVESVIPEFGAILSTSGLLIQGVWGNGCTGAGKLHVLAESWSAPLDESMCAEVDRGQVIAAGQCMEVDILKRLGKRGLGGLIVGACAPVLIPEASELLIPVIVLQGFGTFQPDNSLLAILEPHAGEEVFILADEPERLTGIRPGVIIPMPDAPETDPVSARANLHVGQQVRLFSGTAQGQAGEVVALPEDPNQFSSRLALPAAVIRLGNGEEMTIPQQNLVILG